MNPHTEEPVSLHFPDPVELASERAREFHKLSPRDRWSEIIALMAFGLNMVRSSHNREFIEKRWLAQEQEWQEIQKKLFAQYGQ
jgi:hypothetical protein